MNLQLRSRGVQSICVAFIAILHGFSQVQCVEYYTEKPAWLPSCKIYEPGFTNCSTHSIQKLVDQLVIGIPEVVEEFGRMDPMKLDHLVFKQDNNEVATVKADLTNIQVTGFAKTVIKESRVSKKDFSWQTKIFLPRMRIDSDYKMTGRILLIPLRGAGKMFLEIENMDILMHTKTRLGERGGFTFYNITQLRVDLNMTGVKTNFENIFNGNSKDVERSTNEFFNENWRDFFEALRPLVSDTVSRVLRNLLHKSFILIPAKYFVEDIPTSEKLYGHAVTL